MEEYDVLGNFKDLKSIFKNIPSAAPVPTLSNIKTDTCPILGESFNDDDLALEFESSSSKKKPSVKADRAKKTQTLDVKPDIEPKTNETVTAENVSNRTRRSLRSASKSRNNSLSESLPVDKINDSVNSGKKSTRGRSKKSDANKTRVAQNPPNRASVVAAWGSIAGMPARGRNPGHGRNPGRGRGRARQNVFMNMATSNAFADLVTVNIDDIPTTSLTQEDRGQARARRNIIAERAARCRTVDVVDLITSPMPRVEGFIDLDADDVKEPAVKAPVVLQQPMDLSFDDDNPEMSIKINWEFKPQIFKLRKYQKFISIFEQLAKRENITIDQVFLNVNNKIIKPDDTPDKINYKIFEVIDGRSMSSTEFGGSGGAIPKKKRDPNYIKLKVTSDRFKKPLNIELNKTENFRKLVIKCAEELSVPYENVIKLCFDGEPLDYQQTPMDLELEGGEIIEIHLKK